VGALRANRWRRLSLKSLVSFFHFGRQVGSAISMAYITGQPIVFVGTGQDYYDLKKLNVKSVVQALLK
jgi:signal recognition particle receptor subunit alpha